jgi:hypothetical protein
VSWRNRSKALGADVDSRPFRSSLLARDAASAWRVATDWLNEAAEMYAFWPVAHPAPAAINSRLQGDVGQADQDFRY